MDIVDDIMTSNFLAANFNATYARYIRVVCIMNKNEGILLLRKNLTIDTPVVKMLGI